MKNKILTKIAFMFLAIIFGAATGLTCQVYINLPETEQLILGEEVFYSYNDLDNVSNVSLSGEAGELSVHFLELGNKYTGDCTYIKTGDIDILIDCGSKSNSIPTVSNYLNQYITDNTLEYVIITHAHQDHYAGFATTAKIDSIFDLYKCETIIDFAKTNQKATSATYNNYKRELQDEINNGAKHFTAQQCWDNEGEAKQKFVLDAVNDISLEILYNYYYFNEASSDNDYSVCCMINQKEKHFLFTGDLEAEGEEKMVEYYSTISQPLPQVDLYKAGHHGSKTSSSAGLLDMVQPKVCCVCCCAGSPEYTSNKNNQFPTQDFIDRISLYTKYIYVTTLCVDYKNDVFSSMNGNIVVIAKINQEIGVNCTNNNTILKDTEWFTVNRTWPLAGKQ